ncbi:MAG: HAMP domain-containing histidine kinase [Aliarcobacter sp.]|nr:HAMP domain-containing histidine kinase [Aliarcobacter sp.]
MNKEEKKALISFLAIYVSSTLFLISVILYIYYANELKMIQETCNMELRNVSMEIKTDILDKHMKKKQYIPSEFLNENIKYALLDKNKNIIFSYINNEIDIDYSKKFYEKNDYRYYIETLHEDRIDIKYIVIQSSQIVEDKNKINILILIKLLISSVFIAFIGYLLSKILLNPARKRVDSMDKFIKDSAHELNTPISVLMTSVSMLKNGKNPQKMMKYILSSSKQISQIYNDIHFSAFNELNEDVFEIFNLKELISESVDFFSDISITKNIKINSNLQDCFIKMDRTKTQKLINNLISNAIKYSHKDSIVEINLENNILKVKDFGIGVTKEEQKMIFNRYKRGNNNEGGFGIGLDIVKRVCEEYELPLLLESKKDKETIFIIEFSSILNKENI